MKESFSDLTNVPGIDMYHRFTACRQMLFRIECSVEKVVIIKTMVRLEDSIYVAHIAYKIIVSV